MNKHNIIKKQEVEDVIRSKITDDQFEEALGYAVKKQAYIYRREQREVVLQPWYLVQLTAEYIRVNAFSKHTMDLCRMVMDMEKEHQFNEHGAPSDNHILSVSAL